MLVCRRCVTSVCKVYTPSLHQVVDDSYDAHREQSCATKEHRGDEKGSNAKAEAREGLHDCGCREVCCLLLPIEIYISAPERH